MEKLITHTYHVDGMSCGGCAATVKNKLSMVQGVTSVDVDLAKREAEITSSLPIKTETLEEALSKTHYTIADLECKRI